MKYSLSELNDLALDFKKVSSSSFKADCFEFANNFIKNYFYNGSVQLISRSSFDEFMDLVNSGGNFPNKELREILFPLISNLILDNLSYANDLIAIHLEKNGFISPQKNFFQEHGFLTKEIQADNDIFIISYQIQQGAYNYFYKIIDKDVCDNFFKSLPVIECFLAENYSEWVKKSVTLKINDLNKFDRFTENVLQTDPIPAHKILSDEFISGG